MRILLGLLASLSLAAQTITPIATPSTWSGYQGNQAKAVISALPNVASVCYALDGAPLVSPGGFQSGGPNDGAIGSTGCLQGGPSSSFVLPVNSHNYGNGSHTLTATAFDALGNVLATGSTSVTIANTWPCSWNPSLAVTTSIPLTSNWHDQPTVTGTISGSGSGNNAAWSIWIDGVQQWNATTNAGTTGAIPLDSTQFPDGPHGIYVISSDTTGGTTYPNGVYLGQCSEWSATVNFSQTSAKPSYVKLSAKNIYLSNGGTYTMTPTLINTDGSTGSPATFYYGVTNGTTGIASVGSVSGASSVITANTASGNTQVYVMAASTTLTDAYVCFTNFLCSLSYTFTTANLHQIIYLASNTGGWNQGLYMITFVDPRPGATNDIGIAPLGQFGSPANAWTGTPSSGTVSFGPSDTAWVQISPTNQTWCVGTDQAIHQGPHSHCQFTASIFASAGYFEDQPYRSTRGVFPGNGDELNNFSGYNTFELGCTQSNDWSGYGSGSQATFLSDQNSWVANNGPLVTSVARFGIGLTCDNIFKSNPIVYGTNAAAPMASWSTPPIQTVLSSWNSYPTRFIRPTDEVTSQFNTEPLGGPNQPSATATTQNTWMKNVVCLSATCTVNTFIAAPIRFASFVIHGSTTTQLNNAVGTNFGASGITASSFTFACASCPNGTHDASSDPGLVIEAQSAGIWYGNYYLTYDGLAKAQKNMQAGSTIPIVQGIEGATPAIGGAGWAGGASYNQSITVGGTPISTMAPGGADIYSAIPNVAGLISQPFLAPNYFNDFYGPTGTVGTRFRSYYASGASSSIPLIAKSEGTPTNYMITAEPDAQLTIASCSGNTITFLTPQNVVKALISGISILWGDSICGLTGRNNFYMLGLPTGSSVNVSYATPTFTINGGSPENLSGTMTFQHTTGGNFTKTMTAIPGPGITAGGTNNARSGGIPICYGGTLDGGNNCPFGTTDTNLSAHRGEQVTISGTGTALDSNTFVYSTENVKSGFSGGLQVFLRQIPSLSCVSSCGTAFIIPENNAVMGRDALLQGDPSTGVAAFVSIMEPVVSSQVSGITSYSAGGGISANAYADVVYTVNGLTYGGQGFMNPNIPYGTFGGTGSSIPFQLWTAPHYENFWSVPNFWGGSMAALLASAMTDLLFQPACNSSHYGWMIDSGCRSGSNGKLTMYLNVTNGPETRTFCFANVIGQPTAEYVADFKSIVLKTLSAGATCDTVTLAGGQAVWFAARNTFSLQQPGVSVRLADVPGATKVVVRYGYAPYWLDTALTSFDCGTGTCSVPVDLAIGQTGQRPYRILYLGSNGAVLSTGDVQWW